MIILHLNSTEFLACLHYANTSLQKYGLNRVAFYHNYFFILCMFHNRGKVLYMHKTHIYIYSKGFVLMHFFESTFWFTEAFLST